MSKTSRRELLVGSLAATLCVPTVLRASTADVELCLLFDCSNSMFTDAQHFRTQLRGHVEALNESSIRSTWLGLRPVVSLFAWSDNVQPLYSMQIQQEADFAALQQGMLKYVPSRALGVGSTHHYNVLLYFLRNQRKTSRRIIDISTDEAPTQVVFEDCQKLRDRLSAVDTRVNALCIDENGEVTVNVQNSLVTYDGFAKAVSSFLDYEPAIAKKMLQDLMS